MVNVILNVFYKETNKVLQKLLTDNRYFIKIFKLQNYQFTEK